VLCAALHASHETILSQCKRRYKMHRIKRIHDEKAEPIDLMSDYRAIFYAAQDHFYMDDSLRKELRVCVLVH